MKYQLNLLNKKKNKIYFEKCKNVKLNEIGNKLNILILLHLLFDLYFYVFDFVLGKYMLKQYKKLLL